LAILRLPTIRLRGLLRVVSLLGWTACSGVRNGKIEERRNKTLGRIILLIASVALWRTTLSAAVVIFIGHRGGGKEQGFGYNWSTDGIGLSGMWLSGVVAYCGHLGPQQQTGIIHAIF
jgi:hypothetical protein